MSEARECDVCSAMFKPVTGAVSLDVHVQEADGYDETWVIDLCAECGGKVLAIVRPALEGLVEQDATAAAGSKTEVSGKFCPEPLVAAVAAPAHTDHPGRHYDRTCPGCNEDAR